MRVPFGYFLRNTLITSEEYIYLKDQMNFYLTRKSWGKIRVKI